ncbi:hypothetical protein K2X85_18425 [bacterium]|nr:hypothetical protein [bacterium]
MANESHLGNVGLKEIGLGEGWQVKFDSTIPAGAPTCHFTMWADDGAGQKAWEEYTQFLDAKALEHAAKANLKNPG